MGEFGIELQAAHEELAASVPDGVGRQVQDLQSLVVGNGDVGEVACSSFAGVVPRQVELHQVAVLADEVGADAVHSLLADQIRSEATFL